MEQTDSQTTGWTDRCVYHLTAVRGEFGANGAVKREGEGIQGQKLGWRK